MEVRRYSHKMLALNTGTFLVKVVDLRGEFKKARVFLEITGINDLLRPVNLDRARAIELRDALSRAIRSMPLDADTKKLAGETVELTASVASPDEVDKGGQNHAE